MNYVWIAGEVMVGGIVLTDLPAATSANRKRRNSEANLIKQSVLQAATKRLLDIHREAQEQFEQFQKDQRYEYERSRTFKREILDEIKGDLDRSLAQAHDYVSLLRQIRQHIQAILERHFPGLAPEEAAEKLPNEGAIFFASELMYEKLDATKYLRSPNLVTGPETTFSLHQFFSKYIKIYKGWAIQRKIDLSVIGESFGKVHYFSEPIGAAFQALLDNAIKYSPTARKIDVIFDERFATIKVSVESLGPRIEPAEAEAIFREGLRAEAAIAIEETGMGMGLAIARLVSDVMQLDLQVQQESTESPQAPKYYLTTFSLEFAKVPGTGER